MLRGLRPPAAMTVALLSISLAGCGLLASRTAPPPPLPGMVAPAPSGAPVAEPAAPEVAAPPQPSVAPATTGGTVTDSGTPAVTVLGS